MTKQAVNIDGEEYVKKSCVMEKLEQGDKSNPFMVPGNVYFIRTVTHYYVGELVWIGTQEIVLAKCAWIADTGRFHQFLSGKTVNEVEPYPKESHVIIGRGAIVDMVERPHGTFLEVK